MARATREAGDVPGIEFVAEAERCPVCDGALKVYKRRSRQVITLAGGSFRAIETLKQCGEDSTHPLMGSNALARQVVPRQRYGYDLIVHVGCARHLQNQQRGEIQVELFRQWGIELSTGSLSYLCFHVPHGLRRFDSTYLRWNGRGCPKLDGEERYPEPVWDKGGSTEDRRSCRRAVEQHDPGGVRRQ